MGKHMNTSQQGISKPILLIAVVALASVVAVIGYFKPASDTSSAVSEKTNTSAVTTTQTDPQAQKKTNSTSPKPQIPQKTLTKNERVQVMEAVLDAAEKDIANAKAQLAAAKKSGDTQSAAAAQERLDHMRHVLKDAFEKHKDLGLAYPRELFDE